MQHQPFHFQLNFVHEFLEGGVGLGVLPDKPSPLALHVLLLLGRNVLEPISQAADTEAVVARLLCMFSQDRDKPRTITPRQGSRTVYVKIVEGLEYSLLGGKNTALYRCHSTPADSSELWCPKAS